jgi:predicted nucleic acid-binding protein
LKIIVSDSGPIIHLYEADLLYLLYTIGKIFIPNKVLYEIESYLSIKLNDTLQSFEVLSLTKEEIVEKQKLVNLNLLQEGESEAIILAKRIHADWFITDDTAARITASLMQIEVHGSIGIILWNVANKKISPTEGINALHKIRNTSLWLSNKMFQDSMKAIEDFKANEE